MMAPPPPWRSECRKVARVLQAYLDGELGPDEDAMVVEHLRLCHRCGIDERLYRDVKRSLQGLATAPDPQAIARLRAYAAELQESATGDD